MRKVITAALLTLAFVASLTAQITIPYTFTAGTVIDPDQMNANFTAVSAACNRAGCTLTGILKVLAGTTAAPGLSNASDASTGIVIGTGGSIGLSLGGTQRMLLNASGLTIYGVNIIDSSGRIPAISSTYFANLSGANLTGLSASAITTGTVPAAQLGSGTANVGTWLHGDSTWATTFVTYTETITPLTPAASLTINLALGTHFTLINSTTVTTLTISNAPPSVRAGSFTFAIQGNGTAHPITWPASVKWPGGVAPTLTTTNGKVDFLTFLSYDNGATWYAFVAGQNY